MKFKIPFTRFPLEKTIKKAKPFSKLVKHKKDSNLQKQLDNCDVEVTREQYLGVCIKFFIISFIILYLIFTTGLFFLKIKLFYAYGFALAFLFSGFVFFSQRNYPRVFSKKRERNIEKNLMPALQDILVQINSGVPLFSVMVNISYSDYGELSKEFKKAVKKINIGVAEINVLDEIGEKNSSVFFKRTLWQISNGMRAGSDMSIVIRDSIKALSGEQIIQIQNYGNKLNPLIMFYMLISVIIPALSVTFLTIISSMINLQGTMTQMLFIALFVIVVFIQIMFLGLIKSARPNLL